MKEVKEFINKEVATNSTLVVACSGGPDSMALLSLVNEVKEAKNLKIICAHVNHKIRIESDEEEIFVKKYAEKIGVNFEIIHFDEFQNNKFTEELARKKRYNFFKNLILKYQANYLLTAHHGDDLIETILMRITRGSNLSGYAGIKRKKEESGYTLLRPLLTVTKKDIIKYNEDNNIPYVTDKSNDCLEYTRNRYRHKILPFLKNEDQKVHEKFLQFNLELNNYVNFVNEYIKNNEFLVDNKVDINKLKNESDFIKSKTIELMIKEVQKEDTLDISNAGIKEIMKIMDSDNKSVDLNNGYQCFKDYNYLKIKKKNDKVSSFNYVLNNNIYENDWLIRTDLKSVNDTNFEIRLNSSELSMPLIVRNRKDGDRIKVKNLNGSKKLNDIFIDEKISKEKRDMYPIVVDGNDKVIWIPGIKKSKFAKDKTEKYDIILKYEVINK